VAVGSIAGARIASSDQLGIHVESSYVRDCQQAAVSISTLIVVDKVYYFARYQFGVHSRRVPAETVLVAMDLWAIDERIADVVACR
jgi:hypothetical protein